MVIRDYIDFHVGVNTGMLEEYIIIEREHGAYFAFGRMKGEAFSVSGDSFRELRNRTSRYYGFKLPRLADLRFDHCRKANDRRIRACLLYMCNDGTLEHVPVPA